MNNHKIMQSPSEHGAPRKVQRQACDRCHSHKVRCTKTVAGAISCVRCQRVGAACVYSSVGVRPSAGGNGGNKSKKRRLTVLNEPRCPVPTGDLPNTHHMDCSLPSWLNTGFPSPQLGGEALDMHTGLEYCSNLPPQLMDSHFVGDIEQSSPLIHDWPDSLPDESDILRALSGSNRPNIPSHEGANDIQTTASSNTAPTPTIKTAEECLNSLFQLHLKLYQDCHSSSSLNEASPIEIQTDRLIESSRALIVIIHSLSIHWHEPFSPTPIPTPPSATVPVPTQRHYPSDSATALSLLSCYMQLLLLYTELILAMQRRLATLDPVPAVHYTEMSLGLSLRPPCIPVLEAGLKSQLALHLLARVSQCMRGFLAVCLRHGGRLSDPVTHAAGGLGFIPVAQPVDLLLSILRDYEAKLRRGLEELGRLALQKECS